ncbi:hypothetical protein E2C01_089209 [Portunus trituberculatus]|uniref:Uncharacterized protein n=1 Tax=Portunus trituberculatus TaxID=210409 RepID=A0A5B7JLU1_PORTR|nr:hypothetical protein [Portunus trituberculatus]
MTRPFHQPTPHDQPPTVTLHSRTTIPLAHSKSNPTLKTPRTCTARSRSHEDDKLHISPRGLRRRDGMVAADRTEIILTETDRET